MMTKPFRPAAAAAVLAITLAGSAVAQTPNLSSLHDALHLSPAQEDAWRGYVRATSPDPEAMRRRQSAMQMMASLPAPRRVDLATSVMEQELADFRREGQVIKAFYAQLSPEQQKVFDRQTLALGAGQGR